MQPWQKAFKRVMDLLLSMSALLLLSPFLLAIALAVVLVSGRPALFIQDRVGLNGHSTFPCYKFRTMHNGIPPAFNSDGSTQVLEQDRRVTRVGRILRKYSLDELPQLWNVFLGQMSLIGPRPDLLIHWEMYDETQRRRYSVKPGITGLAQVNGRNQLTVNEKINFDLTYVDNYSLLLDLKILLKTFGVVFGGAGIYNRQQQG